MSGTALEPRAFALPKELGANDGRDRYGEHEREPEAELRGPFAHPLEATTAQLARTALPLQGSRKSMFRRHRDVRFPASRLPHEPDFARGAG